MRAPSCSTSARSTRPGSVRWNARLAAAQRRALPIVLDPVGAGASRLRTETALRLLGRGGVTILRANASEILALAGAAGATKGVDSTHSSDAARDAAHGLAVRYGCAVVVSGVIDYCLDRTREVRVHNGVAMMARITGMGCTASALCGAFCAVQPDSLRAAVDAMAVMGIAGEVALGGGARARHDGGRVLRCASSARLDRTRPPIAGRCVGVAKGWQ